MRSGVNRAIRAHAAGSRVTTADTSATVAIPNADSGVRARRVLVAAASPAANTSNVGIVRPVDAVGGTVTTANGIPVSVAGGPLVLEVAGSTHIAYISANATAPVEICIVPLED